MFIPPNTLRVALSAERLMAAASQSGAHWRPSQHLLHLCLCVWQRWVVNMQIKQLKFIQHTARLAHKHTRIHSYAYRWRRGWQWIQTSSRKTSSTGNYADHWSDLQSGLTSSWQQRLLKSCHTDNLIPSGIVSGVMIGERPCRAWTCLPHIGNVEERLWPWSQMGGSLMKCWRNQAEAGSQCQKREFGVGGLGTKTYHPIHKSIPDIFFKV